MNNCSNTIHFASFILFTYIEAVTHFTWGKERDSSIHWVDHQDFCHLELLALLTDITLQQLKELCHDLRMCNVLGCSADFLNFPPYWI